MSTSLQLETPQLILRAWRDEDRVPFAAINADLEVMRHFAAPLTADETLEAMERYNRQLERDGFTMFAAIERETNTLAGVIGMQTMRIVVPDVAQPAVEIGWRLGVHAQGRGLATASARACVDYAFNTVGLREIVAITIAPNTESRRVMEKLGMTYRPELTFDHPGVPADFPHKHIVYSLANDESQYFKGGNTWR